MKYIWKQSSNRTEARSRDLGRLVQKKPRWLMTPAVDHCALQARVAKNKAGSEMKSSDKNESLGEKEAWSCK